MKYTEPKMELSVFDTENVVTESAGGNSSVAMTEAFNAAKNKAGTEGVAIKLVF